MNINKISNTPLMYLMCDYLDLVDIKKLKDIKIDLKKNEYNLDIYVLNKSANKIIKFWKRVIAQALILKEINLELLILNNDNIITRRLFAYHYFKYYPKSLIYQYYNNINFQQKLDIIKKYKKIITQNPTRFDLFDLIKRIPIKDTLYIGW